LTTVEHAHAQLLVPGAIIIPAVASSMAYLIGGEIIENMLFAKGETASIYSPFNDFAPPTLAVGLDSGARTKSYRTTSSCSASS
jgi:hypothetical protein